MWVHSPTPIKLGKYEKDKVLAIAKKFIDASDRLSKIVNRIEIRSGRVYFFYLYEPYIPKESDGVYFIKPLIDGKYLEFPLARITLFDKGYSNCSTDWKRPNDQWVSLFNGTLVECFQFVEDREEWFSA